MSPGNVSINAEFVDATALWWMVRNDKWGWYLNPELAGRPEHLRVLAWTGGGDPMIWFAVLPDAAVFSDFSPQPPGGAHADPGAAPSTATDLVFFRPPPGVNSFPYDASAKGFADSRHDDTTMYILARYLLSPIPADRFDAIKKGGKVRLPALLSDQIVPVSTNPTTPADPIEIDVASGQGFRAKFRPVGLEGAFNRGGGARVMLLPLAAGDTDHPYETVIMGDLKTTVRSALQLLWNGFAIGRMASATPSFDRRELWLAGHSAGNLSMWACLQSNQADVERIISFDPSPKASSLTPGTAIIALASRTRAKASKTLDVFAVTTPNLTQDAKTGLDDKTDLELRRTGAAITVLPDFSRRSTYWQLPSTSTSNDYLRYLLTQWSDDLLAQSAKTPARWFFLFFHELAVFGGDLVRPSAPPAKPGQKAPAAPTPTVKTFFETALEAPSPRPKP